MTTNAKRTIRFNMLLTEPELEMLRFLAEERGITSSDVFRTLLREAHKKATKAASK